MSTYDSIPLDSMGHRTRFSDSSQYDFVCVDCGATDGMGDNSLGRLCPKPYQPEIKPVTFRQLLSEVERAYHEDFDCQTLIGVFEPGGEIVEDTDAETGGDTLALFIAIELRNVVFDLGPFEPDRELTIEEIKRGWQALWNAEKQLTAVARAIGKHVPLGS